MKKKLYGTYLLIFLIIGLRAQSILVYAGIPYSTYNQKRVMSQLQWNTGISYRVYTQSLHVFELGISVASNHIQFYDLKRKEYNLDLLCGISHRLKQSNNYTIVADIGLHILPTIYQVNNVSFQTGQRRIIYDKPKPTYLYLGFGIDYIRTLNKQFYLHLTPNLLVNPLYTFNDDNHSKFGFSPLDVLIKRPIIYNIQVKLEYLFSLTPSHFYNHID